MGYYKEGKKESFFKKNKTAVIVASIVLCAIIFLIIAGNIVLDNCASPCRHQKPSADGAMACPSVCVKVTLLDWIFGNG